MIKRIGSVLVLFLLIQFVSAQTLLKDSISGLNYIVKQGVGTNAVILLHGYGSNEKDLFSFAQYFPKETTVICPRGPITYSSTSHSWYDIVFKEDGNHERNLEQGKESADKIALFVSSMKAVYNITGSVVIGGFSQGAIMSINLVVNEPTLVDGVIGMSGTLLHKDLKAIDHNKSAYIKLKAFYAHGNKDQLLPIEHGKKCKTLLESCNIDLTYKEYPIAHNISSEELKDLISWYDQHF